MHHFWIAALLHLHWVLTVAAVPVPGGGSPKPSPQQPDKATSLSKLWNTQGNKHPTVFIHGLAGWGEVKPLLGAINYWGGLNTNLLDMLRDQGHVVVAPNVGPLSSNWERACEVFAQLTGSLTDYGVARAAQFKHARFGDNHTGNAMLPSFAQNFKNGAATASLVKINIVGHSLGGPTSRTLTHLLRYGSADEMAACVKAGVVCSPLFWTNKTQTYVNGVFAVSGTLQGSVVDDFLQATGGRKQLVKALFKGVVTVNNFKNLGIWNLQLGHHGLGPKKGEEFGDFLDRICDSDWYLSKSNAFFDLGVANQADPVLSYVRNVPETTYFSVAGVTTNSLLGVSLPQISTLIVLSPFATIIGTYSNSRLSALWRYTQSDWRQNDGLVMVASSRGPVDGFQSYEMDLVSSDSRALINSAPSNAPKKGTYNYVGELSHTDHAAIIGWFDIDTRKVEKIYTNIMQVLSSLSA